MNNKRKMKKKKKRTINGLELELEVGTTSILPEVDPVSRKK
jgi:hypothetical protein